MSCTTFMAGKNGTQERQDLQELPTGPSVEVTAAILKMVPVWSVQLNITVLGCPQK